MRKYIIRRLLLMVPTALLATILVFSLMKMVPGDAALAALADLDVGSRAQAEEFEEKLRERYGLNDALPVQYWNWLTSVGRLEFGKSITEKRPVRDIILERLPRTVELAVMAIVLITLYAIPLGIWAAVRQDGLADNIIRVISIGGLSVPLIWIGTMFIFTSSRVFNWLPPLVWKGFLEDPIHNITMVGIPATMLSFGIGASIIRMTRGQMLEVLREDYIRTARAKGLAQNSVLIRHALRNAVLPVLTQFGGIFGGLLAGTVVVETLFGIPGLGRSMVQAINERDFPVVQGLLLLSVAIVLTVNLVVDLLYSVIDPRIRYS
jgi:peptide/nickel transport system permease protein